MKLLIAVVAIAGLAGLMALGYNVLQPNTQSESPPGATTAQIQIYDLQDLLHRDFHVSASAYLAPSADSKSVDELQAILEQPAPRCLPGEINLNRVKVHLIAGGLCALRSQPAFVVRA